jgi:hypothetical protein
LEILPYSFGKLFNKSMRKRRRERERKREREIIRL